MAGNALAQYRFGPDMPTAATRAGRMEGDTAGEIRSRDLSGDEKVADLMASLGLDYPRARTLAEALGFVVPAAAAHDMAQGAARMATADQPSPMQTAQGAAAIAAMAHPLTRRLSTAQRAMLTGGLAASHEIGNVENGGSIDPLRAGAFVAGAYGGQAAGQAVERGGRAVADAARGWANARTPNAADVIGSRTANEVSGIEGPSMPAVSPGRDLSHKMADDLEVALRPRVAHDKDAWSRQPYHEFGVQGPRSVVRRDVDPQSIAERQQFREGHVLEAQRRMVEEKAARAKTPGTPEYFEYQAAIDAKRVQDLGKMIGGEKFREALKADPRYALDQLSKQTGRTLPELAQDFARLGLDFRNFSPAVMAREGGKFTGVKSPYDDYNAILNERFKKPAARPKTPKGPARGEDY